MTMSLERLSEGSDEAGSKVLKKKSELIGKRMSLDYEHNNIIHIYIQSANSLAFSLLSWQLKCLRPTRRAISRSKIQNLLKSHFFYNSPATVFLSYFSKCIAIVFATSTFHVDNNCVACNQPERVQHCCIPHDSHKALHRWLPLSLGVCDSSLLIHHKTKAIWAKDYIKEKELTLD